MIRKHALKDMTFVEFRERMADQPVISCLSRARRSKARRPRWANYVLTEYVAERIAAAANAIAAPTVPFGYADFFRAIPGGIQLSGDTFRALFHDVARAFLDHGLERIVVINGHTTNATLIEECVRTIRHTRGVAIASVNIWQIIPPAVWAKTHGDKTAQARGHGGDPLASIALHVYPQLVRPDLIRPSGNGKAFGLPVTSPRGVMFDGTPIELPLEITEVNPHGMLNGDPSLARAEFGEMYVEAIVDIVSRFVRHFALCDPRDVTSTGTIVA